MSRFPRIRRRPDHFASPHARARVRAAERLDGPLGLAESTWLEAHLDECQACRAIADAYDADRQALRGLAARSPQPPRDLWARTAAAIEHEARARRTAPGSKPSQVRTATRRRMPIGALSGVAVVALVVGASVVSQGLVVPPDPSVSTFGADGGGAEAATPTDHEDAGRIAGAQPTPFPVGAGEVQWVRENQDGTLAYNVAPIDEVCPVEAKDGCRTLSEADARRLTVQAVPESIIASPDEETAVMVSRDEAGHQRVTVIDLAEGVDPVPTATAGANLPSAGPIASPSPAPTARPTESVAPPTPEPTVRDTTLPSEAPDSPAPSADPVPTEEPSPSDVPVPSADPSVSLSPEPSLAADLVDGVRVVGHAAAFSADGSWFAFTAEPADGSGGPNVFVWQVGAAAASQLTQDDRSTFASWADGEVLVSRPIADEPGRPTAAVNVRIDPATGEERPAGSGWRPTLDPSRQRAVVWTGGIVRQPSDTWRPAGGQLVLTAWAADGQPTDAEPTVLAEGDAIGDFDVRWDETGEWFAVWIADAADPTVGALDLYRVDPATGEVVQPEGAPVDVRAVAGFSIGDGRLAWATPPGQEGEGSRVQIVAWNADGVGTIESEPGEDVVVIR